MVNLSGNACLEYREDNINMNFRDIGCEEGVRTRLIGWICYLQCSF
jgi:hypothetical protein